jgi:formylglycine-generating enzyme required for sulfatase activity
MRDIFISYSSEDRGKAKDIAEALEQQGFSAWWDRSILPGETFDTVIEEALDAAKCVIVLWSKTSVSSKWVKTEASDGKQRGILIPVLIERDVKIPLAFRRIQAADLRDWEGKLSHPGFDMLLKSIADILGRPLPVEPGQKTNEVGGIEPEKVHISIEEPEKIAKPDNSIGMKFSLIPAGEFYMGSEESVVEKPVHKVKINNPFYLGTYPVTQAEWKAVMGDNNNPSDFKGDDLPVEQVSWDDVQEFIKKLNEEEGTDKYRLPSEAEWEYACRAGTTTRYSFGDDESKLGDYGWYAENSGSRSPKKGDHFGYDEDDLIKNRWKGKTHSVGQKKPNPWGLYDMHGNVWEFVQDGWHDSYDGAPTDGSAWESGDGADLVILGGGWYNNAGSCRSANRDCYVPGDRSSDLGFRLLQEL